MAWWYFCTQSYCSYNSLHIYNRGEKFWRPIVLADRLVPCVMFLFVAQLATLPTLYMSSVFAHGGDVVRFSTFNTLSRCTPVLRWPTTWYYSPLIVIALCFVARKFLRNVSDRWPPHIPLSLLLLIVFVDTDRRTPCTLGPLPLFASDRLFRKIEIA